MVYSVNRSVLGIVKTTGLVITSMVCVKTDVVMAGLVQIVQKVVKMLIINKQLVYRGSILIIKNVFTKIGPTFPVNNIYFSSKIINCKSYAYIYFSQIITYY